MKKNTNLLALLIVFLTICGCQKPQILKNPVALNSNSDTIWTACKNELTYRGFTVGFQNRQAGIIETKPLTSKQWFEFWKNDVVDSSSTIKSSMHTTNRIITINIDTKADIPTVECTAKIFRQYDKYSEKNPPEITEDSLVATSYILIKENEYKNEKTWAYIDRDTKLEQAILNRISKRVYSAK